MALITYISMIRVTKRISMLRLMPAQKTMTLLITQLLPYGATVPIAGMLTTIIPQAAKITVLQAVGKVKRRFSVKAENTVP